MRKQKRAAESAYQREEQTGPCWRKPASLYSPLEPSEGDYQYDEQPVLQHVGNLKARPETTWTERPIFRVRPYEHEDRKRDKQHGPVSSPPDSCCDKCEHAYR